MIASIDIVEDWLDRWVVCIVDKSSFDCSKLVGFIDDGLDVRVDCRE